MLSRLLRKSKLHYTGSFKGKEFEVNNWEISTFIVERVIPVTGVHPFPLAELSLMVSAVAWYKPTHIFEWGTHTGKSARVFYEACKFLQLDAEIHSVDLPDDVAHAEHPHSKRGKYVKGKKNVFLHQGDGVDTSVQLYKKSGAGSRALFYLDGDHSYESVYRELKTIIDNVNNPGILLHDTLCQTNESGYNIGPYQAIEDVLKEYPSIVFRRIDTKTGLPGMTFLYP